MKEKYKRLALLGKGATAKVYLVEDAESGKRYAMKVCENKELLRKEARMLRGLTQGDVAGEENLIKEDKITGDRDVVEERETMGGELKKVYFPAFVEYLEGDNALVMEYLEGKDLQTVLDEAQGRQESERQQQGKAPGQQGKGQWHLWGRASGEKHGMVKRYLEPGEAVYIMGEVLCALEQLHTQSPTVIYRDLKPANIMLCRDGSVKLIDLGAACVDFMESAGIAGHAESPMRPEMSQESNGSVITRAGTYGYAAPEQFWEGAAVDRTCDIYSAGKVFAYLITGKNPAEPPYDMENFCRGLGRIEAGFMEVLERSLAVAPQARYETAAQMWQAILRAAETNGKGRTGRCPRKRGHRRSKSTRTYEKCIWRSEYRRIF